MFAAYNEAKKQKDQDRLNEVAEAMHSQCQVIRDGEIQEASCTIGDIIFLGPGMSIPGDGVLLETNDLSIDESPLTGEPFPVRKITYFDAVDQSRMNNNDKALMEESMMISFHLSCLKKRSFPREPEKC